jgi:predicted phosphodiesterase
MNPVNSYRQILRYLLIACLLQLTAACTESAPRGPYLQNPSSTSMVIKWRDASSDLGKVSYGTQPGALLQIAEAKTAGKDREVLLQNLVPETTYYYRVNGADKNEFSFKTPPAEGAVRKTRVWVLGDSGAANDNAIRVRDAFYEFNHGKTTDLMLMLGDNAYKTGSDANYQEALFDVFAPTLPYTPLYSTVGNHDVLEDGGSTYFDIFTLPVDGKTGTVPSGTEAYYSFNYSNIHFACLDSEISNRSATGAMHSWLKADLEANTQDWTVVFFHHPPYSKGSHDSDTPNTAMSDMRQNFTALFEQSGVDLVFTGHSHSYERSYPIEGHRGVSSTFKETMKTDRGDGRKDGDGAYRVPVDHSEHGIIYTVAGSSSKTGSGTLDHPVHYVSMKELGSVVLDFDGDTLDVTFVSPNPDAIDYYTLLRKQ